MFPLRLPLLVALLAHAALADRAPSPTAYSVTLVNGMGPQPVTMKIFRDGQAAVIERSGEPATRSYLDLAKGTSYSWDFSAAAPECDSSAFSGDWGDPFNGDLLAELKPLQPKDIGPEVVNGIKTNVAEATNPQDGSKHRIWTDVTYGMMIKWVATSAGKSQTMVEVKSLTVGKPPAAMLALPPSFAKLAAQPPPQTEAEKLAALTGAAPGKYVKAAVGPGTKESCAVLLSLAQPGTLAPIAGGFRLAVDPSVDVDHPAPYTMGEAGKPLFQGGGLREVTGQLKEGAVRLDDLASLFDVEVIFDAAASGKGEGPSAASALIYKQCFGKRTSRLLLVINPAKASDPSAWVWEK